MPKMSEDSEREPESLRAEIEPTRAHYIARIFPDNDCRICHGGKPFHRHIQGNRTRQLICPTATVEILEFKEGKK